MIIDKANLLPSNLHTEKQTLTSLILQALAITTIAILTPSNLCG